MAKPKATWSTYGKGTEWWSIIQHPVAFDVGYETRGIKRFEFHIFPNAKDCAAGCKAQIAAWLAAGFVKLTPAEIEDIPQQGNGTSAYLGWTGPFPVDARYFRQGRVIHMLATRGDTLVRSGGLIGRDFGELENHYYGARVTPVLEQYSDPTFYKPVERAEVVALYAEARAAANAKSSSTSKSTGTKSKTKSTTTKRTKSTATKTRTKTKTKTKTSRKPR
jgi:hypothetical protein